MNILEHFDHPARKQGKEHFNHLVQIAKADGIIDDSESEMLHRIGRNMGLTEPEIDGLIHSSERSDYIPPYELAKRFEQLYSIVKIVLADGEVNQNEMSLAFKFAVKAGFNLKEIPHVLDLITEGIRNKSDEEDIFELYKKKRKSFI